MIIILLHAVIIYDKKCIFDVLTNFKIKNMGWLIGITVVALLIWIIGKVSKDAEPFKVISFKVRFHQIIKFYSDEYFDNKCTSKESLPTEVKIIGIGIASNKMVRLYYTNKTLNIDIRMKLNQIEYKKTYILKEPFMKSEERLMGFAKQAMNEFGIYLNSKTY